MIIIIYIVHEYIVVNIYNARTCMCMSPEEEISAMKSALEQYGIHMPSFGKIGGLLASEVWGNTYMYMYMYIPVMCTSDCLGCAVLLCLVCLFDLACFFLSSFSSLI